MTLFTRKDAIDSKTIFDGYLIRLRLDTVRADGKETTREVVEHPGGVVIACKPSPSEVLLVRQYRYPVDRELIELPAGRLEPGEDPLPAAMRELAEETGFEAASWVERGYMYPAVGFSNEKLTWYLASDVRWVGTNLDEDEEIVVMKLPIRKAWQLVIDGQIHDPKTMAILAILNSELT